MRRLTLKTPNGPLEYTLNHRARVTKRLHMELDEHGGLVVVAGIAFVSYWKCCRESEFKPRGSAYRTGSARNAKNQVTVGMELGPIVTAGSAGAKAAADQRGGDKESGHAARRLNDLFVTQEDAAKRTAR